MSTFYTQMANTSKSLLLRFGTDVTLQREQYLDSDPVAGTVTQDAVQETVLKGVLLNKKKSHSVSVDHEAVNKEMALLEPGKIAPQQGDRLLIDNIIFNIVNVITIRPALITVLYKVEVTR